MAVPNGVVTYSGVVLGSVATLTCDTGYSVANEYNRTCMSHGHWSKGTLRCDQETTAGEYYTYIHKLWPIYVISFEQNVNVVAIVAIENSLSFGVSVALAVILTFLLTLAL